ncbi:hypothetical protein, partial [Deinococcus frigens]
MFTRASIRRTQSLFQQVGLDTGCCAHLPPFQARAGQTQGIAPRLVQHLQAFFQRLYLTPQRRESGLGGAGGLQGMPGLGDGGPRLRPDIGLPLRQLEGVAGAQHRRIQRHLQREEIAVQACVGRGQRLVGVARIDQRQKGRQECLQLGQGQAGVGELGAALVARPHPGLVTDVQAQPPGLRGGHGHGVGHLGARVIGPQAAQQFLGLPAAHLGQDGLHVPLARWLLRPAISAWARASSRGRSCARRPQGCGVGVG